MNRFTFDNESIHNVQDEDVLLSKAIFDHTGAHAYDTLTFPIQLGNQTYDIVNERNKGIQVADVTISNQTYTPLSNSYGSATPLNAFIPNTNPLGDLQSNETDTIFYPFGQDLRHQNLVDSLITNRQTGGMTLSVADNQPSNVGLRPSRSFPIKYRCRFCPKSYKYDGYICRHESKCKAYRMNNGRRSRRHPRKRLARNQTRSRNESGAAVLSGSIPPVAVNANREISLSPAVSIMTAPNLHVQAVTSNHQPSTTYDAVDPIDLYLQSHNAGF